MAEIAEGMLVRVAVPTQGYHVPIETVSSGPRVRYYHREKISKRPGRFMFGTVESVMTIEREQVDPKTEKVIQPAKRVALVRWAGRRFRTSTLPIEMLIPARNSETATAPSVPEEKTE